LFTLLENAKKRDSKQVLDSDGHREEPENKNSSRTGSRNKKNSGRRNHGEDKTKNPRKCCKDKGVWPGEGLYKGETPAHETADIADINGKDGRSSKLKNIGTRMDFTGFRIEGIEHHGREDCEELGNNETKNGRNNARHRLPLGKTLDNIHHGKEAKTTDGVLKSHKQEEDSDGATTQGKEVLGFGHDKCNLLEHLWRALDQGIDKMHSAKHKHTLTATFHWVKDQMIAELSFPDGKRI